MGTKHREALFSEMMENDVNAKNCLSYIKRLLVTLWDEKEGFSGKRPFGNSGWENDLYKSLIKNGYVKGVIDEYGDIADFNRKEADKFVSEMIDEVFEVVYSYRNGNEE